MKKQEKTVGKQSFIKGAMILTISMALGKVLGALFKIPLGRLIGGVGMGYYGTAYELYSPLYALATAGFPIAISKIVSENVVRGNFRDVRKTHKVSIPLFLITGSIGFLLMISIIPFYTSYVVKAPRCRYTMYALAPTIIFACLMSIYRGYYEGIRDMMPTAVSELIESIVKFVLGLSLAYGIVRYGLNEFHSNDTVFGVLCESEDAAMEAIIPFAAAGAILAIPIGAILGFIYLLIRFRLRGDGITDEQLQEAPQSISYKETIKRLFSIALPVGLGAIIMNLATFIDVTLIQMRINDIMKDTEKSKILLNEYGSLINQSIINSGETHIYLYGCFAIATTIMMLIPAVTQAFGISALPSVTAAWASGKKNVLKKNIEVVLKMTTLITIPSGLGMVALSYPIMDLAFGGGTDPNKVYIAASVLILLGFGGIFASTSTPICSMLQAVGRVDLPVKLLSLGVIMKILLNYVLVGIPVINIQGAGAGTIFCYGFVTIASLYYLSKETKIKFDLMSVLIKPLLAGTICAVAAYVSQSLMAHVIRAKLATALAIIIAAVVYLISLILLRALTAADIKMMPKGEKIVKRLEKMKLIR